MGSQVRLVARIINSDQLSSRYRFAGFKKLLNIQPISAESSNEDMRHSESYECQGDGILASPKVQCRCAYPNSRALDFARCEFLSAYIE